MAIRTRSDYFKGVDVGVKSDELARTSRLVSRLTGYHVQYNKAVVGPQRVRARGGHPPARRARRP